MFNHTNVRDTFDSNPTSKTNNSVAHSKEGGPRPLNSVNENFAFNSSTASSNLANRNKDENTQTKVMPRLDLTSNSI